MKKVHFRPSLSDMGPQRTKGGGGGGGYEWDEEWERREGEKESYRRMGDKMSTHTHKEDIGIAASHTSLRLPLLLYSRGPTQ